MAELPANSCVGGLREGAGFEYRKRAINNSASRIQKTRLESRKDPVELRPRVATSANR